MNGRCPGCGTRAAFAGDHCDHHACSWRSCPRCRATWDPPTGRWHPHNPDLDGAQR